MSDDLRLNSHIVRPSRPPSDARPTLSVVTTLYNSAPTIREFHRRATAAAEQITSSFEIVIVDDGSPDNALEIAVQIARTDPRVRVVELSRNFGHHKALMTGLEVSTGEHCLLIDSDLEEPPEELLRFWKELQDQEVDVVYGYQSKRAGQWDHRISGAIAYFLINSLVDPPIPLNHITLRLMRRSYVDALLLHQERQAVIGGLFVITGFRQVGLPVDKGVKERTDYSFGRRWIALIDSITSFSGVPLVAIFYLGISISVLTAIVGTVLLAIKFRLREAVDGWISVMLSVWFLGGLAIMCIGIIGIYLSRIFIETKSRPYTIIRAMHGQAESSSGADRGDVADFGSRTA